jgi:hypothetical protein
MCLLSRNSGASASWNPKGLPKPVVRKLFSNGYKGNRERGDRGVFCLTTLPVAKVINNLGGRQMKYEYAALVEKC